MMGQAYVSQLIVCNVLQQCSIIKKNTKTAPVGATVGAGSHSWSWEFMLSTRFISCIDSDKRSNKTAETRLLSESLEQLGLKGLIIS